MHQAKTIILGGGMCGLGAARILPLMCSQNTPSEKGTRHFCRNSFTAIPAGYMAQIRRSWN